MTNTPLWGVLIGRESACGGGVDMGNLYLSLSFAMNLNLL